MSAESVSKPMTAFALWRKVGPIFSDDSEGSLLRNQWRRFRFVFRAGRTGRRIIARLISQRDGELLEKAFARDPRRYGFLEWPLVNKDFSVERRFAFLLEHFRMVRDHYPWLELEDRQSIALIDFQSQLPDSSLVIEHAPWFIREGCLNLSLMVQGKRLMTVCFSLGVWQKRRVVYVGSIQGSGDPEAMEGIRTAAKVFHDVRPRDLVLKLLRMLAARMGVDELLCTDESHRIAWHAYFGISRREQIHLDYDEIWREHGGHAVEEGFFRVSSAVTERPREEVPQKKRGRYDRRVAMYRDLQERLDLRLGQLMAGSRS